ncbi:MAG TPA: hypothetical protein VK116_15940, partial [Planctomycetota bacterium]|nr:hypothetical protein [Planctomycetota bacterium]
IEDRKPSVRIIAPERVSEQVSPRARVRIAVEVEDDYGIRGGVLEGRYFAPGSDAPVPQSLPLEGLVAAGVLSPRDALREGTSEFWLDVASLSTGSALPPEPGGRFEFFALAEDFGITDQKHPDGRTMGNIGESQVRLLEIVDERTLERLLIDRLMLVRDQLRQILSRQRALRMNLGEIEDAARLAQGIDPDEGAKLSRQRQDQERISGALARQADEIGHILARMRENVVGDERHQNKFGRIGSNLRSLADVESPRIAEAIESIRRDALDGGAEATLISGVTRRQRQLERDLEALIRELEDHGSIDSVIQTLRSAMDRLEMINQAARRQVEGGSEEPEPSREETTP